MSTVDDELASEACTVLDAFEIDPADRVPMIEGLSTAFAAIDQVAEGKPDLRENLRGRLGARLAVFAQMEADRRAHPGIAEQQIAAPLIITGLPRSGTTILHSLVAQDPAVRSPLAWEVTRPSPPPRAETAAADPRIAAWIDENGKGGAQGRLADAEFMKKHLIGACLPEECGQMMTTSMRSTDLWARAGVPNYMAWWLDADHRWDYGVHRRWLQHLQWRHPGQFWALKYPMHIFQLPALLAVYPDARLVQTHRDPTRVISSLCSLIETIRRSTLSIVDRPGLGREVLELWALGAERSIAFREANPHLPFADVAYRQLVGKPLDAVRSIYARFDEVLSPQATEAMAAFIAATPQHAHGEHRHALEDYGLTPEEVRARMARYIEAFAEWL